MQVREGHAGRAVAHVVVHLHGLAWLPSGSRQAHVQRDRLRSQGVAGRLGDLGLVVQNVLAQQMAIRHMDSLLQKHVRHTEEALMGQR